MAKPMGKYLVDGQWMTIQEVADMLGVKRQAVYDQMWQKKCGPQVVANLYRANLILHDQGRAARFMVDGRWVTRRQICEELGITVDALREYARRNGLSVQQTVDAYREGRVKYGGSPKHRYRVGRKYMTREEVARKHGVSICAIINQIKRKGWTLAQVDRYYEEKHTRKAEAEIMAALGFGKRKNGRKDG